MQRRRGRTERRASGGRVSRAPASATRQRAGTPKRNRPIVEAKRPESLSGAEARRLALAAQGFGTPRPGRPIRVPDIRRVARQVHAFQIDPINVLVRAQYMPLFSRLGRYPTATLDRLTYERHEFSEYYAHQASLVPTALFPL